MAHHVRVEIYLDLGICGKNLEFIRDAEDLFGGAAGVDVLVAAVTSIGELLQHLIAFDSLPAAGSESVGVEGDSVFTGEPGYFFQNDLRPPGSEIGDAIGADAYCRDAAVAAETATDLVRAKRSAR